MKIDIKNIKIQEEVNLEQLQVEEKGGRLDLQAELNDGIIVDYEVLKGIKWYFIELPKFRKANPDINEKLNQWLLFIDDYDGGLIKMAEEKNKTLEKARAEMNYLTGDAAVRRMAELREKWEMDRISEIDYAETKGREEGERKKQLEIAKKMLETDMPIKSIAEFTGLKEEEVEEIKNKYKLEDN